MPLYEFRCQGCGELTALFSAISDAPATCPCARCGARATRIISRPSVHLSKASKLSRLDPRYDRQVDRAMANTRGADPDQILKKLKPLSGGEE